LRPPSARRSSRIPPVGAIVLAVAGLAASGLIACSVLVNRDTRQCSADVDCERLANGSGSTCDVARGVCVALPRVGVDGCIPPGPGLTSEQLPNVCTDVACVPFHNSARGLEDGDSSPLIPPDGGAPVSAPPGTNTADAGTTQFPPCLSPDDGRDKVIYITGSSNFPPLLAKLGPFIIRATGYTPVYQITSSCNGVKTVFSAQARDRLMVDPPPGSRASPATYVTADGSLIPCTLGPGGVAVDIGESDIFSSSCAGTVPSSDVGEYFGPIQAMLFVVPGYSTQKVISAEMARAVFGRGGDNQKATPWIDPDLYFIRNANTGTQQMIGRAIGVPADQFWGRDRGTAANLAAELTVVASEHADQAIGIISNDYLDRSMGNLTELAYQAPGQTCGFWPDSTQSLRDKRNVRDGHYPIWGPLHFFTRIAGAIPISQAAAAFVTTVSVPEPRVELLDAYIEAGLVPSCAMHVQRSTDLGALSAYQPPINCGCYFEAKLANGVAPAGCKPCTTANDCTDQPGRPECRVFFCEAS